MMHPQMVKRTIMFLLSFFVAALPLSAQEKGKTELTVFAAASLNGAFHSIAAKFEKEHSEVHVTFNFAGSQQLAQQLSQGAAADVFASANMKQMKAAIQSANIDSTSVVTFAKNKLVIVRPKDNPGQVSSLGGLARPGLKLVLADKSVPAGQYALDLFDKFGKESAGASFPAMVRKNVVSYEENVKAVLGKVRLGECDAGVVYVSDLARDTTGEVSKITIPDSLNIIAEYPIARIRNSKFAVAAEQFTRLVLSPAGQAILEKWGFIPVTSQAH